MNKNQDKNLMSFYTPDPDLSLAAEEKLCKIQEIKSNYRGLRACIDPVTGEARLSGNTTRLIDYYIQELFTTGHVEARDSHDVSAAHKDLGTKMVNRIKAEHPRAIDMLKIEKGANSVFTFTLKTIV